MKEIIIAWLWSALKPHIEEVALDVVRRQRDLEARFATARIDEAVRAALTAQAKAPRAHLGRRPNE